MTNNRDHQLFRQHDSAPDGVASPLLRQLTQEWADLHTLPSTTSTVRRWGRRNPLLADFTRPGDIVDAIDNAGYDETDALLSALIELFQDGQQLAGRTVLQAMLPVLTASTARRIAAKNSQLYLDAGRAADREWAADREHLAIGTFWEVMSAYPVARRTQRVASNLEMDVLHRITVPRNRRAPRVLEVPHDPQPHQDGDGHRGEWPAPSDSDTNPSGQQWLSASAASTDPDPTEEITQEDDLDRVIAWAVRQRIISPDAAQMLVTVYLRSDEKYGFPEAAAERGIKESCVRKRCQRTIDAVKDAVQTYLLEGDAGDHRSAAHAAA